jgi:flagellar basal body-associated protein FliL
MEEQNQNVDNIGGSGGINKKGVIIGLVIAILILTMVLAYVLLVKKAEAPVISQPPVPVVEMPKPAKIVVPETQQPVVPEAPAVVDTRMTSQMAEAAAKDLLSKKYKGSQIQSVSVSKFTENAMRGEVTFAPSKEDLENGRGGEGGMFLAAKVDGAWKLVYDGNGQIDCKVVKPYGFPADMIKDCTN